MHMLRPATALPTSLRAHDRAPYADALRAFARQDHLRAAVPGHEGQLDRHPGLADFFGAHLLGVDLPPQVDGIDTMPDGSPSPLDEAQGLAADAWGAARTWFLTNGATQGNLTVTLALRGLGERIVVQRSMHSSVMDGMTLAGLEPSVVMPSIDVMRGMAHGVTPAALDEALRLTPDACAAYVVTPSYFGAVSDVAGLAQVAHAHGVPLVVDEAWGAHFGFHPGLPVNALRLGADLVISSTHKLAGSLGQSAMIHLGDGPWADRIGPQIDRALRMTGSTSASSLLMASLDLARRDLVVHGRDWITDSIADAQAARAGIAALGRFGDPSQRMLEDPSVVALDPLRIVVDTRRAGLTGHTARDLLFHEFGVHCEMSTDAVVVALVGAGNRFDADRFVAAFAALPAGDAADVVVHPLPDSGPRARTLREASTSASEVVSARAAIGRVSADSLAAYPPGVPNLLPGEIVTVEVVDYLQAMAAAPHGYVRGAVDHEVSVLRVVRD